MLAGLGAWRFGGVDQGAAARPVIGVSYDNTVLNQIGLTRAAYDLALSRVDADIVTLRPGEGVSAAKLVAGLDGLLLSGGGDVDPDLFGVPGQPAQLVDRTRDDFELELLGAAFQRGIPILGICRGLQLINVALGGSLIDLRSADPERHRTHGIGLDSLSAHPVKVEAASRLSGVEGWPEERRVTSFHGQAIGELGSPLWAVAVAPDGVIEGVELPEESGVPWLVAVQWHPEMESMADEEQLALFRALAHQARLGPRTGAAPKIRLRTADSPDGLPTGPP